jgi:trigger factor
MKADQEERLKRESGMSMEDFYEKIGITKEKYEEELNQAAVQGVKRSLVLEAIAENNDINWTGEEIEAELRSIALNSRIDYKKLQEYAYSNNDYIYEIATRIKNRKTVDFIVTKVKVNEVEESKSEKADK